MKIFKNGVEIPLSQLVIQCCLALKNFPGATIDDIYDNIKPLLKKCPDSIIYVGTNNTVNEPSKVVPGKLLDLKKSIEKTLPESNVVNSNLITRTDNGKTS